MATSSLQLLAELAEHVHVLRVAHAAFDDAEVAGAAGLDVGERRAVEFDLLQELDETLVDVEERHVTAEAPREGGRGDAKLLLLRRHQPSSGFPARATASATATSLSGFASYFRWPMGTSEAAPLAEDDAHRADAHRLVVDRERGVREAPRLGVDDEVLLDAPPGQREHVLAVDLGAGPDAELAEDAAVEVEQHVGVRGVDRAIGEERVVVGGHHLELVRDALQHAAAARLARRAEVISLGEEELDQVLSELADLRRLRLDLVALRAPASCSSQPYGR